MATILLIDDDVDLVDMNHLVLEHRGHRVLAAYSAAEARQVLARQRPDLIVLDVMMETISAGFELAREIHRDRPELPTIILSAVHEATGVPFRFPVDPTWLPVLEFLDKPVEPGRLADRIERILAGDKAP